MVALSVILMVLLGSFALSAYLFWIKEKHAAELRWRRLVASLEEVNVTLDPDTAYPELILSEDRKRVRCGDTWQDLPDNPERFDSRACVLGCEGFTSGRHYWEVEVGDGKYWAVGVARESMRRKGEIRCCPEDGIWAVERQDNQCQVLTTPEPTLLSRVPSRIRVCLDCEWGQVTFIDAGHEAPIFTFPPGSFKEERIRPLFWVWGRHTQLSLCPCDMRGAEGRDYPTGEPEIRLSSLTDPSF
ncbi:butyrophilin subfamily 2 member A2-like [Chelonoidis abingdonii]|uniref:butyrophilin subfamily 2 member A2-like n=1 Tax=Chelonoidis abingdonii TaxID=106734 RepID=UPI003F49949A